MPLLPPVARFARKGPALLRWLRRGRVPPLAAWILTNRCNLRCEHCGYRGHPSEELTPAAALETASQLVRHGVFGVSLQGGEPLLRQDLGHLIALLTRGGASVRVTSNGLLVPDRVEELRALDALKLSLDGPPDLHDRIRGEGAFSGFALGVEAARSAGIPVQVNSVLSKELVRRLDEHLDLVGRLGVTVTFQPLERRRGTIRECVDELMPEPHEQAAAVARLSALRQGGDARVGNSASSLEIMTRWPNASAVRCQAGRWFFRILANGDMVACDHVLAPAGAGAPAAGPGAPPAAAIRSLQAVGPCAGCWRNNTLELNRTLAGSGTAGRALLGMLSPALAWERGR